MNEPFEEKYFDILQNIEFAIVQVYRTHPELSDWDVGSVLDKLIRVYRAEEANRPAPPLRLSELEQTLFDSVKSMCDWRLGREGDLSTRVASEAMSPKTVSEIVACVKRIGLSVRRWTKQGGRQGYLNFISEFIRQSAHA